MTNPSFTNDKSAKFVITNNIWLPGFLILHLSGKSVCAFLCVSAPEAINNYLQLNKFYSFYMAAIVVGMVLALMHITQANLLGVNYVGSTVHISH